MSLKNYQYHSYSPKMHTFGHKESQQKHRQALPIASGKSRHDVAGVSLVQIFKCNAKQFSGMYISLTWKSLSWAGRLGSVRVNS